MYVRFNSIYQADKEQIRGIFRIVGYFTDNHIVDAEDEKRLRELNKWFSSHLKIPSKFWRSKNHNKPPIAVSWFKDSANEHIQNLREISNIIQRYGVIVDFIRTEKPGYILYEDEFQVFAEPFKD